MKDKLTELLKKRKETKAFDKPPKKQTVEEHREIVLEQGRKFKYPIQYSKHKILINALIVGAVVVGLFILFSWWMLYKNQTLGDFYYTATRVIPIPVADVDGEPVKYGDYMRRVRASIYYLEKQENRVFDDENGLVELNYTRRFNMDESERVALANRIAREHNLFIDRSEIDANIEQTLIDDSGQEISQKAYETSLWRYYGWSMDDYREIVRQSLLLRKASFAVDDTARNEINSIKDQLNGGMDFSELAKQKSQDDATKNSGGDSGAVNSISLDSDGLISTANSMLIGDISSPIQGVNAWFIIKLTEKTDTTVRFSLIKINLTEFDKRFKQLKKDGKIHEYIEITAE